MIDRRAWTRWAAVAALVTIVAGCAGGGGGGASGVVGAAGGTLKLLDGAVTLEVPPGALAADTTLTVSATIAPDGGIPAAVSGAFFHFGPDGTAFAQPVKLTLRYEPATLPTGSEQASLQLAKATPRGWLGLVTTVDATAHTASADITGFSEYGLTPGLQTTTVGGIGARLFPGWGDVSISVATDTAGQVYLLGQQKGAQGPLGSGGGNFVARLNANLSVQWLQPLDGGYGTADGTASAIALDQQGNVYVFLQGPYVNLVGYPLKLISLNPSGAVRSGFPVTWSTSPVAQPAGLAIDALGRAHTLGLVASPGQYVYTPIYAVHDGSGNAVRAPAQVSLPLPAGTTSLQNGDLTLDYAGHVYFAGMVLTTTGGGTQVHALRTSDLTPVAGFPRYLSREFSVGFARPANSLNNSPVYAVALPASSPDGGVLNAYDATTGVVVGGFPASIGAGLTPSYSAVDVTGVTYVAAREDGAAPATVWLGSFSPGGALRGALRHFSLAADLSSYAFSVAVDPAAQVYLSGSSTSSSTEVPWIARVGTL